MIVKKLKVKDKNGNFIDCKIGGTTDTTNLLDMFYPVGTYYETSDSSFNPNEKWGGTWVEDSIGAVMVSRDDGDFQNVNGYVGSHTATLTVENLPGHSHTVPAHAHGLGSHTHVIPSHTHGLNGHTHSIPALTGYTNSAGAHYHNINWKSNGTATGANNYLRSANKASDGMDQGTDEQGSHSHTVTTYASTTGRNSGSTAGSGDFTSGAATGTTNNSAVLTSGGTGSGAAFSIIQKSKVCIRWHRIA